MAVVASWLGNDTGTGASNTLSVTVPAGAELLFVFYSDEQVAVVTPTATYNGGAPTGTVGVSTGTGLNLACWYWATPTSGTHDVSLTGLSSLLHFYAVVSIEGSDGTFDADVIHEHGATSATLTGGAISSAIGDLLLGFCGVNNSTAGDHSSTGTGATEIYDLGQGDMGASAAEWAGAASVTPGFSWTSGDNIATGIFFNVNAASGASGIQWMPAIRVVRGQRGHTLVSGYTPPTKVE